MFLLKLYFEDKGQLYAAFLLYVPTACLKCVFFLQFLSRGIPMQLPILTGVENGRTIS